MKIKLKPLFTENGALVCSLVMCDSRFSCNNKAYPYKKSKEGKVLRTNKVTAIKLYSITFACGLGRC